MGFLSNIFSKQTCEICKAEVGALSRTKLKDGKFVCSECTKNCSKFFSPVLYDLEEFKKHLEYMKMQDELYKKEFETIPIEQKVGLMKVLPPEGITFADSIGMFEIKYSKNKDQKLKELFRYDEIMDFKTYAKNTTEGSQKKYSEVGIQIKMMLDAPSMDYHTKHYVHRYVKEFTLPIERNTDNLIDNNNLIYKHLKQILGITLENGVKTSYRNLNEIERYFDREKYAKLADEAEKRVWGKTAEELFNS